MRLTLLPVLLLLLIPLSASAQDAARMNPGVPMTATLQMEPQERQFFALGMTLSRGAFAYAELAKAASAVEKTRSKLAQVEQLGSLDTLAGRNRADAHAQMSQAVVLMRRLNAPASALAPVTAAEARLAGPLRLTSDARPLALFSRPAARTLSSLGEFESLSSLPESPAVQQWLRAPGLSGSAQVWYGEGEIAGLSQIAAQHQMPDLLPPTEQIATDLRGLRDWLALRLPEMPSPEQAALKSELDSFLEQTSAADRPGVKSHKLLSLPQLQALGSISRRLQVQVLGEPATETARRLSPWL